MIVQRAVAVLTLCASGCSFSTDVLEIPTGNAQAILIVTIDPAGSPALTPFSAAPYISVPLGAGDFDVYALRYACSVESLELGRLELAPTGEPGRLLPEPTDVQRAQIRAGRASALELVPFAELPPIRLRSDRSACVSFETHRFDVPGSELGPVSTVLPLPGDRALVATTLGRVWELSSTGLVEMTSLSTTTPILGGFLAGDGEIFVVGERGDALRGRPGGSFTRAPSTTSTVSFLRSNLSGNPEGPLSELFLVDAVKSFERFDGVRWTRIDDGAQALDYDRGGVAWLGPERAIAAGLNLGPLAIYDHGNFSPIDAPIDETEVIRSLRNLEGYGVLIATSEGNIFQRAADGTWISLHTQIGGIRLVAPLDRGLIFGGTSGFFTQLHPGFGLCEGELLAERDSSFVAELEHGFAFGTDPVRDVQSSVAIAIRTSDPLPTACPSE